MQAQPPAPTESLSGLIERVTFFNEENGFAVLKVKAKGHRDEVTVVGSLPAVNAGEWVTAEGRWVRRPNTGIGTAWELGALMRWRRNQNGRITSRTCWP